MRLPTCPQAQELAAQCFVAQERAAHDGVGHARAVVLHASPVHAGVARLHHHGQAVGLDAPLQLVGQHGDGLLLNLRAAHDPVADARVLGQADEIRRRVGQHADPHLALDGAQVVRAGAAHGQRPHHHELVELRDVGECRHLRLGLVASAEDLVDVELGHAPRGLGGIVVVVGVDHERTQHLLHPGLHFVAQFVEFAFLDVISDVVIGMKTLPRAHEAVADALGSGHAGTCLFLVVV